MNVNITIQDIWQRVGTRTGTEQIKVKVFAEGLGQTPALVFYWSKQGDEYFTVEISQIVDENGAKKKKKIGSGNEGAVQLLAENGLNEERIPGVITKDRSNTQFAKIPVDGILHFDFTIDTNLDSFIRDAKAAVGEQPYPPRPNPFIKQIEFVVLGKDDSGQPRGRAGVVSVHLKPGKAMDRYDGYVALDLGNTNSTLVCLDARSRGDARDVEVVRLERTNDAGPIPSALRIKKYIAPTEPGLMDDAVYSIGERAKNTDKQGSLVLGAKRLLADSNVDSMHEIQDVTPPLAIGKEIPAELFLCGLFKAFHERQFRVPRRIAITCPATFSDWETVRLRKAVVQGWRRSLGAKERGYDPKRLRDPELPDIILDEASAAAFYFLYHDYIDETGGLDVLNYLHGAQGGLNLLVYDCGGGTTDIALIHAEARYNTSREGNRGGRLLIEVKGRTGHRNFGGDDITIAAFRALKAKIAKGLGLLKNSPESPPTDAQKFLEFLERNRREIDAAVPTLYNFGGLGLDEKTRRKELAEVLWDLAEAYKIALGSGQESPVRVVDLEEQDKVANLLKIVHQSRVDEDKVSSAVKRAEIHREEIDVQIEEKLNRSIEFANQMMAAKLPNDEVHAVYIVGNASCYPLVKEALRRKLRVPFIDRRIKNVSQRDLKNSVAKGAVLAMRMTNLAENLDVEFDRRLCDRLPFDVTFRDRVTGSDRVLFNEHELYPDLGERQVPVPNFSDENEENKYRELSLERRWPGEDKPQPYLRFKFPEPIQGPVTVEYNTAQHKFVMTDENGSSTAVVGEDLDRPVYQAPVQSGTL